MNSLLCLKPNVLSDFSLGRLDDASLDRVAAHLEQCGDCLTTLQTLDESGDALLADLRGTPQGEEIVFPQVCQRAVARAATYLDDAANEATIAARVAAKLGRIRDYELLEEIGRGGMGAVFKALHVNLKRLVALKILPPEKMQDGRAVARFHREMEAVGKLVHPNIVLAHDAGEADGQHFLVMEFVDGLDLAQIADRCRPLAVAEACELVRQAALGLQNAHENGLVHRDIKPSNLMLSVNGQTKILDLGLALLDAAQTGNENLTGDCQMMGTTDYMAPEQAGDSHTVDIRADIYSLGCTLYRLLVGRAPFSGPQYGSTLKKLMAHAQTPASPVHQARTGVPRELSAVVERMMAKLPAERFATPADVAQALASFAVGHDLPSLLSRARQDAQRPDAPPQIVTETASGRTSALEQTDHANEAALPLVAAATAAPGEPSPAVVATPGVGGGRRDRRRIYIMGGAAAAALLLAGIVIIVKTKSGETKRIELPQDTKQVEVTKDGKPLVTVTPDALAADVPRAGVNQPTKPLAEAAAVARPSATTNDTLDRRVAQRILALGGTVRLNCRPYGRSVAKAEDLPTDSFKVREIYLSKATAIGHQDIAMFAQLRHLRQLTLIGAPLDDEDAAQIAKLAMLESLKLDGTRWTDSALEKLVNLDALRILRLPGITIGARGAGLLARLDRLRELDILASTATDDVLAELKALVRLRSLSLQGTKITDAGLKHLAGMQHLEELSLAQTQITGAGLTHLEKLPRLDALVLSYTRLNDDSVRHLLGFAFLHVLDVSGTPLTDGAIDNLSRIKTLTKVSVERTKITAAGRERLGDALSSSNLNRRHVEQQQAAVAWILKQGGSVSTDSGEDVITVDLASRRFSADEATQHLSHCSNADVIDLSNGGLPGNGLAALRSLPRLRGLRAYHNPRLGDEALADIGNCRLLREAYLIGLSLSDEGLNRLADLPLETVLLGGNRISDTGVAELPKRELGNLSLTGCAQITDKGLEHLRSASEVSSLDLEGTAITDAGLEHLAKLRHLTELNLRDTRIRGEGLTHLKGLAYLEVLCLQDTLLGDESLAALEGFDRLYSLNLRGTTITDSGLEHLRLLADLDVLYLQDTQVTQAGIARLQQALPNCTIFSNFHPETP